MGDLKLVIIDFFFSITFFFIQYFLYFVDFIFYLTIILNDFFSLIVDFFDPYFQSGLTIFNSKILYQFPQNTTIWFAIKFLLAIGFLILIRGGAPRYRYDYLTKLGWLKFLSLIILVFFSSLLLFFIF